MNTTETWMESISPTCLRVAFTGADPKSTKASQVISHQCLLALLGFWDLHAQQRLVKRW